MARKNWIAAAAAAVALSAVLWPFSRSSQVEASTIVQRLRETTFNGVHCRLTSIETDGLSAEGEIRVRFSKALTMQALFEAPEKVDAAITGAYAKLQVTSTRHRGVPDLSLELEAASSADSTWVYGRAGKEGMDELRRALPPLGALLDAGVLVDFGKANIGDLLDGHALDDLREGVRDARVEIEADKSPECKAAGVMLGKLLTGKATGENLKELQAMLTAASLEATVENQGGGRYLLTTRKLGQGVRAAEGKERAGEGAAPDHARPVRHDPELDVLDNAIIRVSYIENTGVEWIEVTDLGPKHGVCRVEFTSGEIDPALFDKTRLIQAGRTSVLNFDALKAMFGPMFGD